FTAIATRDPAQADRSRFPGAGFLTYEEALADPRIEAVVLAIPPTANAAAIAAAAKAGKHAYVEKPLALAAGEADAALAAMKEAGRVLAVGFNRRFSPAFQALSAAVEAGAIGRI